MDHKLVISGAMLVKSLRTRLMSPQHWAQVADDNYPKPEGTLCITKANSLVMKWDQQQYVKTIPIDPTNNCFTFRSTSGNIKFVQAQQVINKEIGYNSDLVEQCIICNYAINTRSDVDENSEEENLHEFVSGLLKDKDNSKIASIMKKVEQADESLTSETDQAEFMRWHYRLGHLPYKKLKILAVMGLIPKSILNVKPPKCAV